MTSHESYDYRITLALMGIVDRQIEDIVDAVRKPSPIWYDGTVERPKLEAGKVVKELIELRTMLNQLKSKPQVHSTELISNAKKHIARATPNESNEVRVEMEGDTDESVFHSVIQISEIWGKDTEHITSFRFSGSKPAVMDLLRILEKR